MNEIEETLLMIFLEDRNLLNEASFEQATFDNMGWDIFKTLELGRTLPEEYEFFVNDWTISEIKKGNYEATSTFLWRNEWEKFADKIKVTIVEE